MPKFYDELLKKPESYRRNVAYIATAFLGVIIFSVWLTIQGYLMRQAVSTRDPKKENAKAEKLEEFKKNLPSLKENAIKSELMKEMERKSAAENNTTPSQLQTEISPHQQNSPNNSGESFDSLLKGLQ